MKRKIVFSYFCISKGVFTLRYKRGWPHKKFLNQMNIGKKEKPGAGRELGNHHLVGRKMIRVSGERMGGRKTHATGKKGWKVTFREKKPGEGGGERGGTKRVRNVLEKKIKWAKGNWAVRRGAPQER